MSVHTGAPQLARRWALVLLALLGALTASALRTNDAYDALVPLKTHSLAAPYVDGDLQNPQWDFGGDAIIDTARGVRLTQDKPNQRGWIWARTPLRARDFQIEFEFAVHGRSKHLFGDGFALWLTRTRNRPGLAFGSKQNFEGLGLAFDTYSNGRHPYSFPRVLALQGNKFVPYIHDQDGSNLEVAGCSMPFRDTPVASRGRLTYVDGEYLEFQLHTEEWDEWRSCFEIDHYKLPESSFLGFSAATGQVSDNHEIISVNTHTIVHKPKEHNNTQARGKGRGRSNRGPGLLHRFFSSLFGWIWFTIKLVLLAGAMGGGAYYGLKLKQRKNVKRF